MPELVYKPVPAADIERFTAVEAHAFHENPDLARLTPDVYDQLRGVYADGRLVAQLQLFPHMLMNGVGSIASGGIGSVATPPEYRRRGYTAELLRQTCGELRERGIWLSMLFPFNRSLYHRYGWASAMERKVYSGPPAQFAPLARFGDGGFEPVGDEAIPELQAVYQGALRGRFGPLVRDEKHWRSQVLYEWTGKRNHALLWRGRDGAPRAYVIYKFEPLERDTYLLRVREAVALDPEARAQIFVLLADHDSQAAKAVLPTPPDAPVSLLMADPPRCEVELSFMLRLVDVAGALSAFPYPKGAEGRLAIGVADPWLDHNSGVFELEISGGQGVCRRNDGAEAGLRCDVRTLTQFYTRYLRPRTAAAFGLLEVLDRVALSLLDQLFVGLAPYCSDYF